jgi:hypothetical protein
MADGLIVERVNEAYIQPIRSVLAVDDDFHQYDATKPGEDPDRAKAIWRACRNRGLLCDIDDGSDLVNNKVGDHLLKSDLVILDYHLRDNESEWSLALLRRLATSEHASLVVVYTKDPDIFAIRRAIAAHLRGVKAKEEWFPNPEIAGVWDAVADTHKYVPTEALVDAYISGDKGKCRSDSDLKERLKELNVPGTAFTHVVDAIYDTALMTAFGVPYGSFCEKPPLSGDSDTSPWVYAHNLFVVCVVKTPENLNEGELVFTELQNALCAWDPNFMMSSVAFARGEFARGGFDHERASLSDRSLQAGWLYHAWAGSVEEQDGRLRVLFERIVRSYSSRILDTVIEFGRKHIPNRDNPAADLDTLKAAIGYFYTAETPPEEDVLHALNEYLAVEDIPDHVETGTVFVRAADGISKGHVYLCVTPACDLVPRHPRGGWEKRMHPLRPIIAMRCKISEVAAKNLQIAEQSRCIFLTVEKRRKVIVLADEDSPVPALEWFVLSGMGKIGDDSSFSAVKFDCTDKDGGGALVATPEPMKVLGQIRSIYANRIMQAAGQHMSRIGVDFVNLPKPSDVKPEAIPKLPSPPVPKTDSSLAPKAEAPTAQMQSAVRNPADPDSIMETGQTPPKPGPD